MILKYLKNLLIGVIVTFLGFFSAANISRFFYNGSAESSFHSFTQGFVIFIIFLLVFCTTLILDKLSDIEKLIKSANSKKLKE